MSICSAHRKPKPGCKACQATPHDLFPDWDEAGAEAEVAGLVKCKHCGFDFYRTTFTCPACNKKATGLDLSEGLAQAEHMLANGRVPVNHLVIESLYFHLRKALGRIRRLEGKEEDGKTSPG